MVRRWRTFSLPLEIFFFPPLLLSGEPDIIFLVTPSGSSMCKVCPWPFSFHSRFRIESPLRFLNKSYFLASPFSPSPGLLPFLYTVPLFPHSPLMFARTDRPRGALSFPYSDRPCSRPLVFLHIPGPPSALSLSVRNDFSRPWRFTYGPHLSLQPSCGVLRFRVCLRRRCAGPIHLFLLLPPTLLRPEPQTSELLVWF